jgi:hypothetical protein
MTTERLAMRSFLGIAALILTGCEFAGITGSGTLISKDVPAGEFRRIDAGGSFKVEITQGEKASVVVTADDNVWELLSVETRDGTLHLEMKPGSYNNVHLQAKIVTPTLDGLSLSGASSADLHHITRDKGNFDLQLSGASSVNGDLQADQLTLGLSGASHARLTGKADEEHIEASGASHASLELFTTNTAHAQASGASEISVLASKHLDYDASGASHIAYGGKPVIDRAQTSGASGAKQLN